MAAFLLLHEMLIDEIEELEQSHALNLERRRIRDHSNAFELPRYCFKQLFRFEKEMMAEIIARVSPLMQDSVYNSAVPKELKILASINFFSHGSYQKVVGQDFMFGMSQPMISRAITEVSNVFVQNLMHEYIRFPQDAAGLEAVKTGFFQKFGVGGVVGTVDGSHFAIVAPSQNDEEYPPVVYYNRKGFYSINVQLICDSDLVITSANARFPGSTHDSAIWATSIIRRYFINKYQQGIRNMWLLGDSGYPIEPWLLTPIVNAPAGTPEARYTRHHARIRNTVERCIGVLKMRFRCLTKARTLHYHPLQAAKIIYTCMVLHNLAIHYNLELEDDLDENEELDENDEAPVMYPVRGIDILAEGRRVRANFIRNYI